MEGRKSNELAAAFKRLYGHAEDDQTTFGRVLEMSEEMDQLMATPGWALVSGLVQEVEAAEIRALVGTLSVRDQADYAQKLAFIRGLRAALDAPVTVKAKADEARRGAEARANAIRSIAGG